MKPNTAFPPVPDNIGEDLLRLRDSIRASPTSPDIGILRRRRDDILADLLITSMCENDQPTGRTPGKTVATNEELQLLATLRAMQEKEDTAMGDTGDRTLRRAADLLAQLLSVRTWYDELLEAIYEDMPDGMNERPDPRMLVRMWRTNHNILHKRDQESGARIKQLETVIEALRTEGDRLREDNAVMARLLGEAQLNTAEANGRYVNSQARNDTQRESIALLQSQLRESELSREKAEQELRSASTGFKSDTEMADAEIARLKKELADLRTALNGFPAIHVKSVGLHTVTARYLNEGTTLIIGDTHYELSFPVDAGNARLLRHIFLCVNRNVADEPNLPRDVAERVRDLIEASLPEWEEAQKFFSPSMPIPRSFRVSRGEAEKHLRDALALLPAHSAPGA